MAVTSARRRPPKISSGDVIEVDLSGSRFAYLQDLGPGRGIRLARFLPGIYDERLRGDGLETLVAGEKLYTANCLTDHLLAEDGARIVGRLPVPEGEVRMPAMISGAWSRDWRDWWVRDEDGSEIRAPEYLVRHPGAKLEDLPKSNDTPGPLGIRARIEAGWTPTNRVHVEDPTPGRTFAERLGRRIERPRTRYFAYFPDKNAAECFGASIGDTLAEVELPEHDQDGLWEVRVEQDGYLNRKLASKLRKLAKEHGGMYDGDIDIST